MADMTPDEAAVELQAQKVAARVAEILEPKLWSIFKDRLALEIGSSILKKFAWLLGLSILALFFWLARKGIVTLPNS